MSKVTSGADIEAKVGQTAQITTSGAMAVTATGDNDAKSKSDAGSGGLVGIAGAVLRAEVGGAVEAEMDGDVTDATSVTVTATGNNNADAEALTIAVGLVGGAGAGASSEVLTGADVTAKVGSNAVLTTPDAPVLVTATGDNNARAQANGGSASLSAFWCWRTARAALASLLRRPPVRRRVPGDVLGTLAAGR